MITTVRELHFFTRLTSIANQAFQGCQNLTEIDIPNFITALGHFTFQNTGLANVVLPASVASIGDSCFRDTANSNRLQTLTMYRTTPATLVSTNTFSGHSAAKFYVPADSVNAYKTASYWSSYASRIFAIPAS